MARIRTIKPEFCTSEQVAECSTTARLLFVTIWCFCDDAGRHPASVRRLKMECFPGDAFTPEQMTGFVDELLGVGLLVEFEFEGQRFWQVTGWSHQKIDKPTIKHGPKEDARTALPITTDMLEFGESSPSARQPLDDDSSSSRRPLDDGSPAEGKGMEGSLPEGNGVEGSGIDDQSPTPRTSKQTNIQKMPPSVDEVRRYMADQGYPDEATAFVDHYTANGWVQGRGKPIKDWRAAARNWQRNSFTGSAGANPPITYAKQREANMKEAGDRFVDAAPDATGPVLEAVQ